MDTSLYVVLTFLYILCAKSLYKIPVLYARTPKTILVGHRILECVEFLYAQVQTSTIHDTTDPSTRYNMIPCVCEKKTRLELEMLYFIITVN